MTDEQKTTQAEPHDPFKGMPFAAMMKKMMSQQGCGCNCAEMMAQMATMCGGGETESSAQEAAQKAKGARNG